MMRGKPLFEIETSDILRITDAEISNLLQSVYVDAGFTTHDEAKSLFEPTAVRNRGVIIAAREKENSLMAGMIIVVPASSPASRLAKSDEAELHLLGVMPEFRGYGLGRKLINAAKERLIGMACSKIILWTQGSMLVAQKLYESLGFEYTGNMERNGRTFKVYQCNLDVKRR